MDTTWFPHGYHVLSMCTPCGFQVVTTMFQMWTPYNFDVKITLFLCEQNIYCRWQITLFKKLKSVFEEREREKEFAEEKQQFLLAKF